jgi:hypothetical protein
MQKMTYVTLDKGDDANMLCKSFEMGHEPQIDILLFPVAWQRVSSEVEAYESLVHSLTHCLSPPSVGFGSSNQLAEFSDSAGTVDHSDQNLL